MKSLRAFSTTAKAYVKHQFTYNNIIIEWADRQHHSTDGDYLIKAAIDAEKAKLEEMGVTQINFRYVASPRFSDLGTGELELIGGAGAPYIPNASANRAGRSISLGKR